MKRLLYIFLLLLLPLQSFALQGDRFVNGNAYDISHEVEHREGVNHHHEHDGSIHYDQSEESSQHFSEHSASQPVGALLPIEIQPLASSTVMISLKEQWQYLPDPIPERPQRPPSRSLG